MKKKKEKEIIYKRKGIKAPILWEKTFYCNDLIDESRDRKGEPTGNWKGISFRYRFLILQRASKNRFLIEPLIEEYGGETEQEMVDALEKQIDGLEEWDLKGRHFRESPFFPEEVNEKLVEYNLEKYVKKIS